MVQITAHGGGCCGIYTLWGFDHSTHDEVRQLVAQHDRQPNVTPTQNRLLEAVLSQRQMDGFILSPEGGWLTLLNELGFVLVNRFLNANSGRVCYVFHRNGVTNSMSVEHPDWVGRRTVLRQEFITYDIRTIVHSAFYNVYRTSGRSAAGWPSREQAETAAPRAQRIDCLSVYSDGTTRWTENV